MTKLDKLTVLRTVFILLNDVLLIAILFTLFRICCYHGWEHGRREASNNCYYNWISVALLPSLLHFRRIVVILMTVRCGICGKPLKDPQSIQRGVGPVCFSRLSKEKQIELMRNKQAVLSNFAFNPILVWLNLESKGYVSVKRRLLSILF